MNGPPPRALEAVIGAQLRAMRTALGMTIAELARAADISPSMLSKIENGQISPSLATLQTLAGALNMPIGALFARFDEKRDASFVKAGQGVVIERRGSRAGHVYQLLGASLRNRVRMEPYLITLTHESDAHPIFQHEGVEFLFMLEGVLVYRHGAENYRMEAGDALFFDADAPHGPLELVETPIRFLSIIASAE